MSEKKRPKKYQFSLKQLLLFTAVIGLCLWKDVHYFAAATFIVAFHVSWWWLLSLKWKSPTILRIPISVLYCCSVAISLWLIDLPEAILGPPSQHFAFAGFLASVIKLYLARSKYEFESTIGLFSTIATGLTMLSCLYRPGDAAFFSQSWILGSLAVFWLHAKIRRALTLPIPWINGLSTIGLWIGLVAITLGAIAIATSLSHGNREALGLAIIGIITMYCAFACLSLAITVKLLSNPKPNWALLGISYFICLVATTSNLFFFAMIR